MDTNRAETDEAIKEFSFIFCCALCAASGIATGFALHNLLLGAGVIFGLTAIVAAIFFSKNNQ